MTLQNNAVLRTPAVATILGTLLLGAGCTSAALAQTGSTPNLGPNVIVFDPSMPTSQIQATVDKIAAQQVSNQFGPQRYALFFKPGTYGTAAAPLNFQVGFYTEVAGLGASPDNVVINGSVDVYNQCDQYGCTALDNFWRSLSNLKYLLQRVSGLGILLFLGAHVLKARILPATEGHIESWSGMHEALSEPLTFAVYALGLLGVSYHLANGLWTASMTWGLSVSPKAQKRAGVFSIAFFLLLLGMSGAALYGFQPFM